MRRSGFFSIGRTIARALTCAALIVIAFNPALAGTQALKSVGAVVSSEDTQALGLPAAALANHTQKHHGKTAPARCKGRLCLEPAVQQAALLTAARHAERAPAAELEDQNMNGLVIGAKTPPPKPTVS